MHLYWKSLCVCCLACLHCFTWQIETHKANVTALEERELQDVGGRGEWVRELGSDRLVGCTEREELAPEEE